MTTKQPVLFVSHGSPMIALENDAFTAALEAWGQSVPKPRAIVALSAHWESGAGVRVTTSDRPETIHDFGGFPDELYDLTYPSPGNPALAREVVALLTNARIEAAGDPRRGYDHGVWIPLRRIFPKADVPVVEISLGGPRRPEEIFKMGRTLAPLRERGVLLFGSGGIVHNLRLLNFADKMAPVEPWAKSFDDWAAARLAAHDADGLFNYRDAAPSAALAVPTSEHFDPLFFVVGAAGKEKFETIFEGFHHGSLSMRTFATPVLR